MRRDKNLDFEINLMPVISILAVCLSLLLLTAVWVPVGTFNLDQALGTEGAEEEKKTPSIWAQFGDDGSLSLIARDAPLVPKELESIKVNKVDTATGLSQVEAYAKKIKEIDPEMNVALILPSAGSTYQSLIAVMDRFKKEEIRNIGIAPL